MAFTPEFAHQSHADFVRIPCIVFFIITPFFLAIRLYNRIVRRSGFGLDDATIFIAFFCTLAVEILMMLSVNHGFGRHIATLSKPEKLQALKLFYVAQIFYKLTINLTKTSILLLYLRIFVQKWFRICCYVLIGIVLTYMVASTAVSIWQCTPIRGAWDKSIKPTCVDLTKNWYANAGFSIATDFLILLLPMQPIWTSKLPINQKRALIAVFLLGFFVTITSILRATTLNFSTTSPDTTYDIASTLWTFIEENVAIICACLPMCRVVLAMFLPSIFGGGSQDGSAPSSEGSSSGPYKPGGVYPRPSSPRPAWMPYSGPGHAEGTSRSIARHSDDRSEEYILTSVQRQGTADEQDGAIRKTTKYEISYEPDAYQKV
ncbi:Wortmanamides biosynthesis cluster C-like protein [Cladobotryum mycophilum]|uniref:Wortmanamides biosynthesis cluster C-like protein n=1 Tax=Cladobotryum mycophilum TaxID=491253 RepID=A0ABR0SGA2_9HYPO